MKTTKIVMGMAAAAVMALSLTGCMGAGNSFAGIIDYSQKKNTTTHAEATASINYTNDTTGFVRDIRRFDRKKKGITARIVMEDAKGVPGVMGIAFDMKKNSDGTWNFILAGAGYAIDSADSTKAPCVYIARYRNIKPENFTARDFGCADGQGDHHDFDITGQNANKYRYFTDDLISNNAMNIVIEVQALTESEDPTNAYTVRFYKENGENVDKFVGLSDIKNGEASDVRNLALVSVDLPRADVDNSTGTVQEQMGFYANVYGSKTLKGEWQVADIAHNPNVSKTASDNGDDSFIKLNF